MDSGTVMVSKNRVIQLYAKRTIQNRLAENKNSVLEHRVWFSGRKTPESFEKRLRTFDIMLNNPSLCQVKIDHSFLSDLLEKQVKSSIFGALVQDVYQWDNISKKKEVLN